MVDRSIEQPLPKAFKRQAEQKSSAPRTISKETADKLFVGMMGDQARFGVGRTLLGPRMAGMLTNLRDALRRR